MANFFVRKTGNDSSAGTSAGAAWLTIGKALGASGMSSGDTTYIGAGVYRESVTVAMTAATGTTSVIADVEGQFTGDAGEVRWTAYTTNDKTTPATKTLIMAGRPFLSFQRIVFVGGSTACVDAATTTGANNITFQDCTFFSGTGAAAVDVLATWSNTGGAVANWTIDRCIFVGTYGSYISLPGLSAAAADYNLAFVIRNCLFVGGSLGGASSHAVIYATGGGVGITGGLGAGADDFEFMNLGSGTGSSLTGMPGGIIVQNCTNMVGGCDFFTVDTNFSTTIPCYAKNNVSIGGGFHSGTSGSIVEDYNVLVSPTPRTNVSTGTHSVTGSTYSPLIHVGQEQQQLRLPRPFGRPTADSPLLAYGNDSSNPAALSVDFLNRPRPSGGGPMWASANLTVGCQEAHDFGTMNTGTVNTGSVASIQMAGPGDHTIIVPVTAVATTISIAVNRDGSYGGGTKPQLTLVANGQLGVSSQTVADTGSASTWNTITLAPFTPSGSGWVTLRLVSNSAGTGNVYWDTLGVS